MPYTTRAIIETRIPAALLLEALDDNADGLEDEGAFDALVASASAEVDGYLSGLFTVPFAEPIPSKVAVATAAFVCELVYQRRNVPADKNPFATMANWWREHLQKVGNRELPFDAAKDKAFTPGASIVQNVSVDGSTL